MEKNIIYINRFDPSTKLCSDCGYKNNQLTLSDREWVCKNCGSIHDRDINAAINIKLMALDKQNLIGQELPKFKPLEIASMDDKKSSKVSLKSMLSKKKEANNGISFSGINVKIN